MMISGGFLGCSEDVPRMLSRYFQLRGPGGPSRSGGFDGSVGPDGSDGTWWV